MHTIVTSQEFAALTLGAVVLNVFAMCLPYHGEPEGYTAMRHALEAALTCAFTLEMGMKLAALGFVKYWCNRWNAVDGSVVLLSLAEAALLAYAHHLPESLEESAMAAAQSETASLLRLLRILRLVSK